MHLGVSSDFLVRELKEPNFEKTRVELIVAELGHGRPQAIMLSSNGDNVLHDHFPLNSYAREIEGGLLITGIDLHRKTAPEEPPAPARQVEVKLVHASNEGQSLVLSVSETCTILELRKAAMTRRP
eukprot:Skav207301  [mRNA]  locus=scaffold533:104534:107303:+ [translate_table: standard]